MKYESFTDIPTILFIKINERIGYVHKVIVRINNVDVGEANWFGRVVMRNGARYSIFSLDHTFMTPCKNQEICFHFEANGHWYTSTPDVFDVKDFCDGPSPRGN